MKVAVIIPMHNFGELTDACIEKCRENAGIEHEILVVDDFSEAPYKSTLAKIIRTKANVGFTKAVNIGLRALQLNYDYVLILNNDTIPQPNFLKTLVDDIEQDPILGIVGSARQDNTEIFKIGMEGEDLTTGSVYYTHEDIEELRPCVWLPFCSVLFSKNLVQSIGLLDERMKNHCSDNDYCLRAVLNGFQVACDTKSRVIHYQSVTVKSLGLEPYQDQRYFAYKWFGPLLNEVLNVIPVNSELNRWGQIGFKYETRKKEGNLVLPNGDFH